MEAEAGRLGPDLGIPVPRLARALRPISATPNAQPPNDGEMLKSGCSVLGLFAFFGSRRSLDDSHRVLVQIANLRGLLEFGGSCNGIEAACLPVPQLGVEPALPQKLVVCSVCDNRSPIQHDEPIHVHDRAQAMSNGN